MKLYVRMLLKFEIIWTRTGKVFDYEMYTSEIISIFF